MPNLLVRPYEDRDIDGFWYVRDVTYNNGASTPLDERVFKTTQGFVAELDGKVAGVFSVLDMTCTRGTRATLKCAGIAGVAVAPEYRHLGVGSEMMRWSIRHLKNEGYQVASLYGFRETFYRKFGYEVCGARAELTVPSHRLPRLKPELPVQRLNWDQHQPLQPCLEAFAGRMSGMNVRTDKHWSRVLDEKKAIYAVGDPIEAYAIVDHAIDFWVPQRINEVVWSTLRGYRSIVAVLSGIAINKSSLQWYEPYPSAYVTSYLDQGVELKLVRPVMYRLLDVPGTLRALSPVDAGSFTLHVQDELIPENEGPWRIEDDGNVVSVTSTTGSGLSADIRHWGQAYLGEPSLASGYVTGDAAEIEAASRLLPGIGVYCQEFF